HLFPGGPLSCILESMWTTLLGMAAFGLGIFLLLVLLSPKERERQLNYTCQRCLHSFASPPLHPLPERYQEQDLCLCDHCSSLLEDAVAASVRGTTTRFLAGPRA
ncbi:MAG: hypothetical protein ACE5ID_03170, partial [Acidobacteriota bacterium]